MMNFGYAKRLLEIPRLVQAKSGNADAFVELCDAYVERVYRYIHFLVPNNGVAEGLAFQVFFKAWDQFSRQPIFAPSFALWLYSLAREQVISYHQSHRKHIAPDNEFKMAARGGGFREEYQTIRDGLRFLPGNIQHILVMKFILGLSEKDIEYIVPGVDDLRALQLQGLSMLAAHLNGADLKLGADANGLEDALEKCLKRLAGGASSLDECLSRYPKYSFELEPLLANSKLLLAGREVKPLPTFRGYILDALNQHVQVHPYRLQINLFPAVRRAVLTFAMLIFALLAAGTASAQSALPGQAFYTWKRTSEEALRAVSFNNRVAVEIFLSERRLNELIAVAGVPSLRSGAMQAYQDELSKLESSQDSANAESLSRIVNTLLAQQEALVDAGISAPELDEYLNSMTVLLSNQSPVVDLPTVVPPASAIHASTGVSTTAAETRCPPNCEDEKSEMDSLRTAKQNAKDNNSNANGGNGINGTGNGQGNANANGNGKGKGNGNGGGNDGSNAGGNGNGNDGGNGNGNGNKKP